MKHKICQELVECLFFTVYR